MNGTVVNYGYRPNVAIVLFNKNSKVLWARRISHDGWQFPQGGVDQDESSTAAALRELEEELGVKPSKVRLIGSTKQWFKYDIPSRLVRIRNSKTLKGQKQRWFLFEFLGADSDVCLDASTLPEFDDWKWVDYWVPVEQVVNFKKDVYRQALEVLEPLFLDHQLDQYRQKAPQYVETNHMAPELLQPNRRV